MPKGRFLLIAALTLAGCDQKPTPHERLYQQTNENPHHAISAESATSPFGHPELRIIFDYFAVVVQNRAKTAKEGIKFSPIFWYQNIPPAQGEAYTKLVIDMGPFEGYKEWHQFLEKIEARFLQEWNRAKTDIEEAYGLEAYLLYAFNPDEHMASFTLTVRNKSRSDKTTEPMATPPRIAP